MSTFIDIGSMRGEEIEWGIEHGYEVHAFEPNPNMKPYLQVYKDLATINYAAAWNEDGIDTLHLMFNPEPGEDGISLIKEKSNVSPTKTLRVQTISLGKYLKKLDKDIHILKINAEGAEYIILESILDHFNPDRIKHWLVEDHSNYISDEEWAKKRTEVLEKFKKLGIKIKHYKFIESLEKCLN